MSCFIGDTLAERGARTALVVSNFAIKPQTLRRYQSVFSKWKLWCQQNSLGVGLENVRLESRGLVFISYLEQAHSFDQSLAHISASLHHFLPAMGFSSGFLDDCVVSRVLCGYSKGKVHVGKDAADEEVYKAMWEIVDTESGILFGGHGHKNPFVVHMTAVAASLEFHWGFRVSQVGKSGDANHFLIHGDVFFVMVDSMLLNTSEAVDQWSVNPTLFINSLIRVNFGIASTKTTEKCQTFELKNGFCSDEDSLIIQFMEFLDYSKEWIDVGEGFDPFTPVFETFYLGGTSRMAVKRRVLDQSLVSGLVKTAAARAGRDPGKFATHSWRRGSITALRSNGMSAEETMRISMHRDPRSLAAYDESVIETGALRVKNSTKEMVVTNNKLRALRRVARSL